MAAIAVFAEKGFHATPVADVSLAAGVSPAYAFRLFDGKLGLFTAAVAATYSRVASVMEDAAEACESADPTVRLAAMTAAYVDLITDRNLIMMQVQAQSASSILEIRRAVQAGLGELVTTVTDVSGATPPQVQRFIAYGQLCHLIVEAELSEVHASWAADLTAGIQH